MTPPRIPPQLIPRLRQKGHVMAIAGAAAVIAFGAILTFALPDGSVGGFYLRIAGVILMLGGALLLLLLLLRTRSRWSQSTARSRQDAIDDQPPPSMEEPVADARQASGRGSRCNRPR